MDLITYAHIHADGEANVVPSANASCEVRLCDHPRTAECVYEHKQRDKPSDSSAALWCIYCHHTEASQRSDLPCGAAACCEPSTYVRQHVYGTLADRLGKLQLKGRAARNRTKVHLRSHCNHQYTLSQQAVRQVPELICCDGHCQT